MATVSEFEDRTTGNVLRMGALSEATAGLATVILAIIGLANIVPGIMLAIAIIVVGVAFLFQSAELAAENGALAGNGAAGGAGPGITLDFLVGGTGIVLGILALVGLAPMSLIPAALIVFGGALLLGGVSSVVPTRMESSAAVGEQSTVAGATAVEIEQSRAIEMKRSAMLAAVSQAKAGAAGAQILIGLAVIVLGILAYILHPAEGVLAFVALIAVGASLLLTGAADSSLAQLTSVTTAATQRWRSNTTPTTTGTRLRPPRE